MKFMMHKYPQLSDLTQSNEPPHFLCFLLLKFVKIEMGLNLHIKNISNFNFIFSDLLVSITETLNWWRYYKKSGILSRFF